MSLDVDEVFVRSVASDGDFGASGVADFIFAKFVKIELLITAGGEPGTYNLAESAKWAAELNLHKIA